MIVESAPPKITNNKYRELYLSWRNARLKNLEAYKQQIDADVELLQIHGHNKILDVGCAFGFTLMELSRMGFDCHGIEITPEFADIARSVSDHFNLKANITNGDACHLPYRDCTFDAVMSTEFFSHVSEPEQTLNEQIRVLKKGGRLLIRDGNILCPVILYDLLFAWTLRTRGRYGGLKWVTTRQKVIHNYDNRGFDGKAEDVKSLYWWRRILSAHKEIEVEIATTGFAYRHNRIPKAFAPFLGNIIIVARRIA